MSVFKRTNAQRDLSEVNAISGKRFEEDLSKQRPYKVGQEIELRDGTRGIIIKALTCGYTIENAPDRFIRNSEIVKVIS